MGGFPGAVWRLARDAKRRLPPPGEVPRLGGSLPCKRNADIDAPARPVVEGVTATPTSAAKLDLGQDGRRRSRGFAFSVVACTLVALVGCAMLNVAVDPRGEFGTGWVTPLVDDQVGLRLRDYEARAEPPADLVLGSSRAKAFPGLPGREEATQNLAIEAGTVEDALLWFEFVVRHQGPPARVILVLDQFAFTDLFDPKIPRAQDSAEVLALPHAGWLEDAQMAVDSLDPVYLRDTLHSLELRYVTGYPPRPVPLPHPLLQSESLARDLEDGKVAMRDVAPQVDDQFQRAFGPDSRIAPTQVAAFEALVDAVVANGTTLDVVLPPFHPAALADLEANFPNYATRAGEVLEAALASCRQGVFVFDYSSIGSFDGDPKDFRNQSHVLFTNGHRMASGVASGRGEACARIA